MKTLAKALLVLSLFGGSARAAGPISLLNFQIAGIGVVSTPNNFFAQGSWTPSFSLGIIGIRGEVGVTALDLGAGRFLVTNYDALLQFTIAPTISIEAGAGLHIWHGVNPAALAITGNFLFSTVPGIDRLFFGVTRYTGGTGAWEARVGIGFEI